MFASKIVTTQIIMMKIRVEHVALTRTNSWKNCAVVK